MLCQSLNIGQNKIFNHPNTQLLLKNYFLIYPQVYYIILEVRIVSL